MPTPLFPLHVVLYPGKAMPLRVFEPRYREMMDDVLAGDATFAVVAIRAGLEVGSYAETFAVGCLVDIEDLARGDDGRCAMIIRGTARVRIDRRLPDDPYPRGETSGMEEHEGRGAGDAMAAALRAFGRYREASGAGSAVLPPDPVGCSYAIAAALEVPIVEQQRLLEAPSAADRLRLAAEIAGREAALLERLGPPVFRTDVPFSGN